MQWLMLQNKKPDDFVISTGKQYSIRAGSLEYYAGGGGASNNIDSPVEDSIATGASTLGNSQPLHDTEVDD